MVATNLLTVDLKLCSADTPHRSIRKRSHPIAGLAKRSLSGSVPASSLYLDAQNTKSYDILAKLNPVAALEEDTTAFSIVLYNISYSEQHKNPFVYPGFLKSFLFLYLFCMLVPNP